MDKGTETDANLLERVTIGDRDAFSGLFDRYATTLTRYAWAIASSREDVEEIVQDTFVTLWSKAGTFTIPDESLLPWLLVVCRNHALNAGRKAARSRAYELSQDIPTPTDAVNAREELRWVRDEIESLAPLDRKVCEMCLLEGRSYSEAADVLGISVGAVTQRVSRSRSRLRKAVTRDGF